MPLTVHVCKRCGKENRVPDRYHGKELKCPGCGEAFSIASPVAAVPAAPVAPAVAGSVPSAAEAESPPGPTGLGGWLAVFIGWLTIMALYSLYQYLLVREVLQDVNFVQNISRLQSGAALEYFRLVEALNGFGVFAIVVAILSILVFRKVARLVVITVLLVNLGLGVWDYVWVTQVFEASTREALQIQPGFMAGYLTGRLAASGIGIAYMLGSKRVKNTLR